MLQRKPLWFKGIVAEDTEPFSAGDMVYGKLCTESEPVGDARACRWNEYIITEEYCNKLLEKPITVLVKSGTLSEYTGLSDASGTWIYENDILTDGNDLFKVEYRVGAFRVVSISGTLSEDLIIDFPRGIHADDQYFLLSEQLQAKRTFVIGSAFAPGWLLRLIQSLVKEEVFMEDKPIVHDEAKIARRLIEDKTGQLVGPFGSMDDLLHGLNQ